MIVDGVCRLLDIELGGLPPSVVGEGEEEGSGRASELASFEPTAPRHVRVATK